MSAPSSTDVDAVVGDHRGRGALRQRGGNEVVAVEALARERHEEIAREELAAVGRHAREAHVGADGAAVDDARGGRGVHHAALQVASAASASCASENGVRLPCNSW